MKRLKEKIKKFGKIALQPTLGVLPGQIAFFLVLSIFPLLTLVGIIASFFSLSIDSLLNAMQQTFPSGIYETLSQFIQGKGFDSNIGIFMIICYIIASNGAHSITLASNMLYDFKNDDYLKRRIKALFLIELLVFVFVFLLGFLAFGNSLILYFLNLIGNTSMANIAYFLFILLKWPFAVFIIYFMVKLVYTIAPDSKVPSRTTTKGAIFTTIGWALSTAIFTYYINHFARYDIYYGSLSNIVAVMIWVYILSYILTIGIAINADVYKNENSTENEYK
jgi:membrane protein